MRSFGVTWELVLSRACMSTPLRHRGADVGNFFLGDKEGGAEFTDEDEEVLLLFAAQAAAAIVNARTYRAEQRARADLETLVETSPVGVVVFDARTGRPASFNREARRMFEVLRVPDHPREHVLEVATCRFADGREIELDRFPLVETMKRAETLRAEEMVVSTPGGGSLRVLLNATPIHAEDGTVRSLVCHRAGPGAARGARPDAGGFPGDGEPRAAHAAGRHQGFDDDGAGVPRRASGRRRRGSSSASSTSRPTA